MKRWVCYSLIYVMEKKTKKQKNKSLYATQNQFDFFKLLFLRLFDWTSTFIIATTYNQNASSFFYRYFYVGYVQYCLYILTDILNGVHPYSDQYNLWHTEIKQWGT